MAITLLEMLLDAGLLTPDQCDEALQNRVFFGGRIGTSLIELGFVAEEDLARLLSKKLFVPYVGSRQLQDIPPEIIDLIPRELALKYQVVPISLENRRLNLVMADPSALTAIDEIAFITGQIIRPLIAPEIRVIQALGQYYGIEIDERCRRILEVVAETPKSEPEPAPEEEAKAFPHAEASPENPEERARQLERYSIDRLSRNLVRAENREEIAEALIRYLGQEFALAALFRIKNETASGWKAVRRGEEFTDVRMLHIPLTRPSVLKTVAENRSLYLGALSEEPLNARLIKGLGGDSGGVLVMPLLIGGRTVALLVIEGPTAELETRVPELHKLLTKAALAFEILIAREKILMT